MALGSIQGDPEHVIPSLLSTLEITNGHATSSIIYALGRYGQLSRPAIPKIQTFLTHPDKRLREEATNALLKIAPEALSNAPPIDSLQPSP